MGWNCFVSAAPAFAACGVAGALLWRAPVVALEWGGTVLALGRGLDCGLPSDPD